MNKIDGSGYSCDCVYSRENFSYYNMKTDSHFVLSDRDIEAAMIRDYIIANVSKVEYPASIGEVSSNIKGYDSTKCSNEINLEFYGKKISIYVQDKSHPQDKQIVNYVVSKAATYEPELSV